MVLVYWFSLERAILIIQLPYKYDFYPIVSFGKKEMAWLTMKGAKCLYRAQMIFILDINLLFRKKGLLRRRNVCPVPS